MNPEISSSWDDSESSIDPENHQAVRKSQRYRRVLRLLRAERKYNAKLTAKLRKIYIRQYHVFQHCKECKKNCTHPQEFYPTR